MSAMKRGLLILACLVVAICLATGGFYAGSAAAGGVAAKKAAATPAIEGFDLFLEAWKIVERDYVGDLPANDVVSRGTARGLVRALNDHATALLAPEFAKLEREDSSGYYKGIGASVRPTEEAYVAIALVFDGGPAAGAGLKAGDLILSVDGRDMREASVYEVVSLIRGEAATMVRIRVMRPSTGEVLDFEVERREIEIPNATLTMLPEGIALIQLSEFNSQAGRQLHASLLAAREQGAWAVILDLRDNPGGFLDQAIAVADEFLDEGVLVIERGRLREQTLHSTKDGGEATDLPLVVLINGGSASASEIVAGAVQDRRRGVLVGEKSYGKGSVQFSFDLSDGSQLRVTTAHWYTPGNRLIEGSGLEPDIAVAPDETGGSDPQLRAAVQFLLEERQ